MSDLTTRLNTAVDIIEGVATEATTDSGLLHDIVNGLATETVWVDDGTLELPTVANALSQITDVPDSKANIEGDNITSPTTWKTNLSLDNVDNTSDSDKPVSTAQAAAIAVVQADVDASEAAQAVTDAAQDALIVTKQPKSGVILSGGNRAELEPQNFGLNDISQHFELELIIISSTGPFYESHDTGNNRFTLRYADASSFNLAFVDNLGNVNTISIAINLNTAKTLDLYYDRDDVVTAKTDDGQTATADISAYSSIDIGSGNTAKGYIGSSNAADSIVMRPYASWTVLFDADQKAALEDYGPDYVNARWPEIARGSALSLGVAANWSASNYAYDVFSGASASGFSAQNTTDIGIASFDMGLVVYTGQTVRLRFNSNIVSGSPLLSLATAYNGSSSKSNAVTIAESGSYVVDLTATDTVTQIALSEGDKPSNYSVSGLSAELLGCTTNLSINEQIGRMLHNSADPTKPALLPASGAEWIGEAKRGTQFEIINYSVEGQTGSSLYLQGESDNMVPEGVRVIGFEIEITSGSISNAYMQFEADSDGTLTTITEARALEDEYDTLAIIKDTEKLGGSGALLLKGTFNTITATIRVLGEKVK